MPVIDPHSSCQEEARPPHTQKSDFCDLALHLLDHQLFQKYISFPSETVILDAVPEPDFLYLFSVNQSMF